jgi:hypothetical protein
MARSPSQAFEPFIAKRVLLELKLYLSSKQLLLQGSFLKASMKYFKYLS